MGGSSSAELLERLPSRFVGDVSPDSAGRFRISVGRTTRDVLISSDSCRVELPAGKPDSEICTDPRTWADIDSGRLSGIEAFAQGRVSVRGSIERSLFFEPCFDRPTAGGMSYSMHQIAAGKSQISTLIAGKADAPPLLLVHGLGATKASWLPVVPALARRYRVIAIDLPGFGASSKPRGRYDARSFSNHAFQLLDALGVDSAYVAGNSMGGRIALEMAMQEPERVNALACLCPPTAFSYRPALWLAKVARPELSFLPIRLPRRTLRSNLKELFSDPGRVDDHWYDAAIDDFLDVWRHPSARVAFFAALKNIYLEEPYGEAGFWSRLSQLEPPALFVYGARDPLITPKFAHKVGLTLPSARIEVWKDCGHVPQIEFPERAGKRLLDFFATASTALRAG